MSKEEFHVGCPKCIEPQTTIEHGRHIFIGATGSRYGAKCLVVIKCDVCGFVEDVSFRVNQISKGEFDKLVKGER